MIVSNDYVMKQKVIFVKENESLEQALNKLTESSYRCIPVLDENEKFVGNVYKVHILEYEREKGDLAIPVQELVRDQEGFVNESDPFFKVFSSIKRLPYLAILDEDADFLGILTHANVLTVLENAWGANNGSYSLTIGTVEFAGALQKMLKIVNKFCSVQSVISLNNNSKYARRVCIVLPKNIDSKELDRIEKDLNKNNFIVTDVEKLN
ncbi:cyclic di-AMP binding protein CbpA [Virgibacillus necropolis]|uniref:Hemolysin-like protein n=1 Tax=Virgibacillus necropolis TaxID=163877 RepID=A0A221M8E6_9BACI|nr:cyclic di-AMP binding protein CbpA [Virgibacillus necropolis]ASN03901.1 hemolysin-like protein [Virgibacillus necropolis]